MVIAGLDDVIGDGTGMEVGGAYLASFTATVILALDVVGDGTEMKVGGM